MRVDLAHDDATYRYHHVYDHDPARADDSCCPLHDRTIDDYRLDAGHGDQHRWPHDEYEQPTLPADTG